MGLPIDHFIAATNVNDVVPSYLITGKYQPKPSVRTISNAMDVGNPSNFARMQDLFKGENEGSTWNNLKEEISGYAFTDQQTEQAVQDIFEQYNYTIDPHGAVGYLALEAYQKDHPNTTGIVLETAHPSKFKDDVDRILDQNTVIPERLATLAERIKIATPMTTRFKDFKTWLMATQT
jgi:threonine synthase